MTAAAVAGLAMAVWAYLSRHSGVDHTPGAMLVIASTLLLALAGTFLWLVPRAPGWLRMTLCVLCLLDVIGTAAAAWFLLLWLLIAAMTLALVGWALVVLSARP